MRTARQFREVAWNKLTNRYWWAVLVTLVAMALGGLHASINLDWSFDLADPEEWQRFFSRIHGSEAGVYLWQAARSILLPLTSIATVYGAAAFIVGGAVELGYDLYFLELYRSAETPQFETLFARFTIFARALGLRLLMWIKTLLWTLLFIVPGIIASLRYAMAPFLVAEYPDITANDAIERSKQLMIGNKWRLFCLRFSFIGWYLLSGLVPFGVGPVLLSPYTTAADTAFYLELTGRLPIDGTPFTNAAPQDRAFPAAPPADNAADSDDREWV